MKSKLNFSPVWILVLIVMIFLIPITWGAKGRMALYEETTAAFVNANVIPMNSERILANHTVIIKNGLIAQVGPVDKVQVPEGAVKINGAGKYLMPGIADMHVHAWGENDLKLFIANGVTMIRNMWGSPQHLAWKEKIAKGEMFSPSIYTAGPLMDGPPPIWEGSELIETPEQAIKSVEEQVKLGYDFIKVYNRLSKESYDAIMVTAKKHGIPVAGHVPDKVGIAYVLKSGLSANEHLTGYIELIEAGDSPVKDSDEFVDRIRKWKYVDETKIPAAVEATLESGMWNCVTLVVYQKFVSAEDAKGLRKRPEMRYVDPMILGMWDPTKDFRSKKLTSEDFKTLRDADAIRLKLTGALHRAGAPILLGTDTPNPFVVPGFSIHEELQNLVNAGLTPYEAFKAGTVDGAKFLGQSDLWGTIEPGKRADLVLLEANPLADVANFNRRAGVMVRGKWHTERELKKMLDDLAASYKAPKNRFAQIPALPREGDREFSGRYELKFNEYVIGEERFAVEKLANDRMIVLAQSVTDAPYEAKGFMRLELDTDGKCYSVDFKNETKTGVDDIRMERIARSLKITGKLASGAEIEQRVIVPEDIVLGSSMVGAVIPVVVLAESMKIGETKTVKGKSLQVSPAFQIPDEELTIKREADAMKQTPKGVVPVRVYHVDVVAPTAKIKQIILLNVKGQLLELELQSQMGSMIYNRVE
jgi:imidazolonepropionase-like amidohydrolase